MKKFILLFLACALATLPCLATNKSVTTVSATASTILTVAPQCTFVIIQNNGLGDIRYSIDGGSVTNSGGSDPTASVGAVLKAGAYITLTYFPGQRRPVIRAILVNATITTLDIITDDIYST